ncbi:hypothetical protein SAMN06269185_1124 [Natronoarchaeum philippinense]|uniref:Uncharacterized protein n=1 Tax=Natronoarchaeum philippinense TaxID=558529 RepID=A0A285NBJ7_NATPI|nr:hypothetical protein [Natronoarchaeum philippinense]SNZ06307.1 hypothetical protein SAMN06269185_1124 [Natronoarchaeum philippinense]
MQVVAAIITISTFAFGVFQSTHVQELLGGDDIEAPENSSDTLQNESDNEEGEESVGGDPRLSNGLFEIVSTTETANLTYRFTVDGAVAAASADGNEADVDSDGPWDDTISDSGDGTVTVMGKTGNQDGDAFEIDGSISSFERTGGDSGMRLEFDDEFVTPRLVTDPMAYNRTFEIISTSEDDTFTYQFIVDGAVYEAQANGNQGDIDSGGEWEDTIRENDDGTVTVFGREGLAEGDVFLVNGDIEEFWKTGGDSGMILQLDERDVTDEFVDNDTAAQEG